MVEFLETAVGLRPLAHPRTIDRPCRAFELRRRILKPAVIAILDQRLLVRGETFKRLAVQLAVIGDAFAGGQLRKARRERSGVEAQHGLGVTLEKASPAIPRQPRPAGGSDETLHGGRCATDVEHRVQHARHRPRRARPHRYQERLPAVAEALSGRALQELDAFFQSVAQVAFGMRILADDLGAKLDREHEGRRHRQTERRHPRQVRGFGANRVGGMLLGRYAADTHDMHGLKSFS